MAAPSGLYFPTRRPEPGSPAVVVICTGKHHAGLTSGHACSEENAPRSLPSSSLPIPSGHAIGLFHRWHPLTRGA
jgi:hypothetical protein